MTHSTPTASTDHDVPDGVPVLAALERELVAAVRRDHAGVRTAVDAPRRRRVVVRRAVLAAGLAAAVAAAVVVGVPRHHAPGTASAPPFGLAPASALMRVTAAGGGSIRIVLTDLDADAGAVNAELRARHIPLEVSFVPASPSLVGTAVMSDFGPRDGATEEQLTPGGPATVVTVTDAMRTSPYRPFHLVVGRPARHGEVYESSWDAQAKGELLDCHVVTGHQLGDVRADLARRHLRFEPRNGAATGTQDNTVVPPARVLDHWWVTAADSEAPGQVMLWLRPTRPAPAELAKLRNPHPRGC